MGLVDDVSAGMKEALRAKDSVRLGALRNVRAAFVNEMKKDGAETLADEACIAVLRKLEKQRKESIEAYEQAGREDRASAERAELAVVQEFLPALADAETTRGWVSAAIEQTGASGKSDLGKVMGAVMKAHKGDVDGNLARALASELLGG